MDKFLHTYWSKLKWVDKKLKLLPNFTSHLSNLLKKILYKQKMKQYGIDKIFKMIKSNKIKKKIDIT